MPFTLRVIAVSLIRWMKILGRHAIGQTLTLRVLRQSKLLELRATVSGQPEDRAPRG